MKIGIIGGTGAIGEGMAMRMSQIFDLMVGSRECRKAQETCECCLKYADEKGVSCSICGVTNQEAVDGSDVIILAIPFKYLKETISCLTGFEGKIIISPVNPMVKRDHFIFEPPVEGSAALMLKGLLPKTAKICTAFNNISGNKWRAIDEDLDFSVPVSGDDPEAKMVVIDIVDRISLLKGYDAGPLDISPVIEGITPLCLNIARFNKMKDVGIRFV